MPWCEPVTNATWKVDAATGIRGGIAKLGRYLERQTQPALWPLRQLGHWGWPDYEAPGTELRRTGGEINLRPSGIEEAKPAIFQHYPTLLEFEARFPCEKYPKPVGAQTILENSTRFSADAIELFLSRRSWRVGLLGLKKGYFLMDLARVTGQPTCALNRGGDGCGRYGRAAAGGPVAIFGKLAFLYAQRSAELILIRIQRGPRQQKTAQELGRPGGGVNQK